MEEQKSPAAVSGEGSGVDNITEEDDCIMEPLCTSGMTSDMGNLVAQETGMYYYYIYTYLCI